MPLSASHRPLLPCALWLGALGLVACGDPTPTPVPGPVQNAEIDFGVSEEAALRLEQDLAALLLEPLVRGQIDRAARAVAEEGSFAGLVPVLGPPSSTGPLEVRPLAPPAGDAPPEGDPSAFLSALLALAPVTAPPARAECELERFRLDADSGGKRATARVRLRWAGDAAEPAEGATRLDLTLRAEIEAERDGPGGDWRLLRFLPLTERPGERIAGGSPRFTDRTSEVGLTFGRSPENVELLQAFIDRHRTLTLGGLSVVDWNRDGFVDLIATRSREASVVFVNDGKSGFVPVELPIADEHDMPAFVLFVDLDGDGLEEIVAGQASLYDGDRAYAGLWTRTGTESTDAWRHLPRAFPLPNAVGLRRLAVQTVTPLDVEGDGDLDLFFAIYGSGRSRGDEYNTVEAYDGADNHLLINQGALRFTEESEARGISGTGYSYVALAFDADHDGDDDLFEGNDFGPNVLWRNEDGRFVADEVAGLGGVSAYTMGAALGDLEADGRWDLYVSNMSSEEGMRMVPLARGLGARFRGAVDTIAHGNMLYSEGAPGAPWAERARGLGIHEAEWAWGCQFVEPFADGTLGLVVTNGFASHRDRFAADWQTYYWRQVIDDARALEEGRLSRNVNANAPRFRGSFNGYERDRFFVPVAPSDPDHSWVDAGWMLGMDDDHDGRAVVPIDADGDGDMDLALWTLRGLVYRENKAPASGWTRLRLLEAGGSPALGARVVVIHGGQRNARHVALVEGFQSQISPDVHVGLGGAPAERIDAVEITWRDGTTRRLEGLAAQRLITVTRGTQEVKQEELPRWTSLPAQGERAIRDWASELTRLARTPRALGLPPGSPMIVRVHADPPPAPPIGAFGADGETPSFSGVRIVDAYLRTGAPSERAIDSRAELLLEPELFAAAMGNTRITTLITDDLGSPLRVFHGPVPADEMAAFCELARHEPPFRHLLMEHGRAAILEARYRDAAALFERATADAPALRAQDAFAFEGWGRANVYLGRLDLAELSYRRAVELDPDYATGWFNLAVTHSQQGRFQQALPALGEARRVEGPSRRVMGALAEAHAALDDPIAALAAANERLDAEPEDVAMLIISAKLHVRLGEWALAIQRLEQATAAEPANAEARRLLSEARSRGAR